MVSFSLKLRAKSWANQNIPLLKEKTGRAVGSAMNFMGSLPGKYEKYQQGRYQKAKSRAEKSTGRRMSDSQFSKYKAKQRRESERKMNIALGSSRKRGKDPLKLDFKF